MAKKRDQIKLKKGKILLTLESVTFVASWREFVAPLALDNTFILLDGRMDGWGVVM